MTRDEIITEARRLFESEKTLRIRDDAPVIIAEGGHWVSADVFVPEEHPYPCSCPVHSPSLHKKKEEDGHG